MNLGAFLQRRTEGTAIGTTAETTVYAAEVQFVQLASIRATNKDTTAHNLTVSWYDASASTSYRLHSSTPVQANTPVNIPFDDGFTLREGDAIRVQADAGNVFDVMVTVIETPGRLV